MERNHDGDDESDKDDRDNENSGEDCGDEGCGNLRLGWRLIKYGGYRYFTRTNVIFIMSLSTKLNRTRLQWLRYRGCE